MSWFSDLFKPLLTREEHEAMEGPGYAVQRTRLRQKRQVERQSDRETKRGRREPWLQFKALEPLAEKFILDLAADHLPGPQKMDEVLDNLAEHADDFIKVDKLTGAGPIGLLLGTALEAVDGPIIRLGMGWLVKAHVQRVYDRLKAEGRLAS